MLTKEYNIVEVFTREPWKGLTFKQVKSLSKNKSDNYVHNTLKKFAKEHILKQESVNNSILYKINTNIATLNLIGFVAEYKAGITSHLPHKVIERIASKIKEPYFTLLVTGSYAKKTHAAKSDLDIVVICSNAAEPKSIMADIMTECDLSIPKGHPYVFTVEQFSIMLTNKEANYGKEIAKNNLVITGGKQYFQIVMGAVQNGFNG